MFRYKNNNLQPILFTTTRRTDNHSTILFTNARDEPNIAEWIAHHLLLGFDRIVVFDHLSKVPITFPEIRGNSGLRNRVEIIRVDGTGNIKIPLMNRALEMAVKRNDSWMLYLDADEYLHLKDHPEGGGNVKAFLQRFSQADAVGVNWLMFGSSGHRQQPRGLITENFIRSQLRLNSHVKSFVRPSAAIRADNPHYFVIADRTRYYSANGTRMPMGPFNNQPLPFMNAAAYVAHYYIQSEEEHMRRKNRMLDDGSTNKHEFIKEIHKEYNTVANNQLQNKYSAKIKQLLKENNLEIFG